MTLRVPCEHGKWDSHWTYANDGSFMGITDTCPGGREPTVEEVEEWLDSILEGDEQVVAKVTKALYGDTLKARAVLAALSEEEKE